MTSYEYEALSNKALSHQGRTLYIFYLRDMAIMGPIFLDYGAMSDALVSTSHCCPFEAHQALIDEILSELNYLGLIAIKEQMVNGQLQKVIVLPYLEMEKKALPQKPFIMHASWRPGPAFTHAAKISGLLDPSFSEKDLQGFIDYWSQKAEARNQAAWERAFVLRLKRRRQGTGTPQHKALNTQSSVKGYDVFGNPYY